MTVSRYLAERYLPVYPVYLTLWVVAVESMAHVLGGAGPWRPTWDTALKALALIAAGAFLRMVDDQKDLDYDRRYNPSRPLVQGRITTRELQVAMAPAATVALLLAAAVSLPSAAMLAAALGYGLALWWAEPRVARIRDDPLVNLAVVCPAQFLVTGFIMVGQPGLGVSALAAPLVFTAAFLHLEFARKTSRISDPDDPHCYSRVLGATGSALASWAFGVSAVLLEVGVTGNPLPLPMVLLPCVSAWIFLARKADEHPRSWPTAFVIAFYLCIVVQGLAHT
ncbi:UbiA family prenyltransferase [Mycobacterium hackensackense]|uniref:UbiA family prenyltransferase n=1 Tax=Mycobacterium hackensackense TaxID=228909 RepID=UPI00226595AC|nr:UbiA family prenyltransferase [Mycobacterium hackensackense]MCV7252607.1 UbiA family prenyltransferase [Mycobacterium hackensackense]